MKSSRSSCVRSAPRADVGDASLVITRMAEAVSARPPGARSWKRAMCDERTHEPPGLKMRRRLGRWGSRGDWLGRAYVIIARARRLLGGGPATAAPSDGRRDDIHAPAHPRCRRGHEDPA